METLLEKERSQRAEESKRLSSEIQAKSQAAQSKATEEIALEKVEFEKQNVTIKSLECELNNIKFYYDREKESRESDVKQANLEI